MNLTVKDKMNLARTVAWIAAVFCLVISVMLIANYFQLKTVDPLETPALQSLVERLRQDPQDEALKNDIRALDLMIRKAYFTSQWQIRTGSWMLVLGVLVSVLAIRYQKSLRPGLEEMESISKDAFLDKQLARKWLMYSGVGLLALALLSGFFSNNILDEYEPNAVVLEQQISPEVEVVDVLPLEESAIAIEAEDEKAESAPEVEDKPEVKEKEIKPAEAPAKTVAAVPTQAQIRQNYPYFRGPDGTGISYKTNVPEKFDATSGQQVLWKVKVPKHGYNSPVIWDDLLFVSGADNAARVVYCYNKNTGDLLWEAKADQIPGSPATMPKVTEDTGLAAPSMATNGSAVFAIFGTGDLIALDMAGKRLWAKNLGVPDNHYGHSSSLIIYKNKLIVQYDTNRGSKVIALSVIDGSTAWETQRNVKISWASPVLVTVGNKQQLILTAEPLVAGYDPETGKELWTVDCMMGEVGPSVGYANGIVYAANEYATLAAIKLGEEPEIVWEDSEYLPEVASPLAADGLLIIATSYGVVACYDALEGTKFWEQEYSNGIYASPVYADGKVYIMDMGGNLHVVKMAKEYQLVAESKLGEKSVCSPVFADGKMYLRGFEHLYCIGK
ncbi:PQQ-binding-like beta-propeller repeat protein [Gaoshiqia sediminis]|uniref:PQQ-binding-like beta-propeller repeat protein n=1 Tax=Gaoshiqia sediminis TaxID=2986998 RepID=A0AA41Y599_9BACT|nr:PQQ-binding-like beta-propeller repeat protein [Gaoshiqia sediminis]MCW0482184.1 PQQ-binding-like beta-propeller repeat protein [Gaoshiqia sediminis]